MKYNPLLLLTLLFGSVVFAQQPKELHPTTLMTVDIDKDLVENFNTKESLKKCTEVWDKMSAENRGWIDLTSEEKKILRYCGEVRESPWEIVGGGCSWYCGSGLGTQTASSYLASQGNNSYVPSNAHDLSYKTAWVEGVPGYGIGEFIEYEFPPDNPRINTVVVVNGYVKSQSAWINNSRVKKLKMYVDDKPYAYLNLEDKRAGQKFSVDVIGRLDRKVSNGLKSKDPFKIKFEIAEVYKGNKYDDVVITEIYFDGIDVHCFAAGTKVMLADRTEMNIEELVVGQEILSLNQSTGVFETAKVTELASPFHHNLIKLTFSNDQTLQATDDHPYYSGSQWLSFNPNKTTNDYDFDQVGQLTIGSTIQTLDGEIKVLSIDRVPGSQRTYTIVKLDRNHSFIANGIVVGTEELRSRSNTSINDQTMSSE